ncbi:MAG: 3'(2'),5'-bisphosphate nucleotidase CysQ [bacterium]|jgi:myo-inositol-1(or 4)-monophosphatase|nr:3'(2'),5'-bisphosphate nucleotidase CysQ [Candidatus Neomarinimicrobiota bacterium]HIL86322.1 3'(2'),5'-bisphosphate nucleotidase CysQ [Candidatus Neomarinimicrobiota bacterium]
MFSEELIAGKVAARNAGKILMKYFSDSNKQVKYKSFNNPVTIADYETDRYLLDFIGGEFPDDGWLSEETVDTKERLNKSRVWIVDPLDGTKEFIEGVPHFSVSIALVEDGYPVVGIIYNPYTEEMFSAQKDKGASFNGSNINISKKEQLKEASITVSRSEYRKKLWEKYSDNFGSIEPIGSVAYKLGLVGANKYDIFSTIAPKNEWDICAGDCIVREAGGLVKTINDKNIIYNQKKTLVTDPIIATNSILFNSVTDLLY